MYSDILTLLLVLDLKFVVVSFDVGFPPFGVTICAFKKAPTFSKVPPLPYSRKMLYTTLIPGLVACSFFFCFLVFCVSLFLCLFV